MHINYNKFFIYLPKNLILRNRRPVFQRTLLNNKLISFIRQVLVLLFKEVPENPGIPINNVNF